VVVLLGKEKKERESDPEFGAQQANVVLSTSLRVLCMVMYVLMAKSKRGGVIYFFLFSMPHLSSLFTKVSSWPLSLIYYKTIISVLLLLSNTILATFTALLHCAGVGTTSSWCTLPYHSCSSFASFLCTQFHRRHHSRRFWQHSSRP
jgi:hypothetical protein